MLSTQYFVLAPVTVPDWKTDSWRKKKNKNCGKWEFFFGFWIWPHILLSVQLAGISLSLGCKDVTQSDPSTPPPTPPHPAEMWEDISKSGCRGVLLRSDKIDQLGYVDDSHQFRCARRERDRETETNTVRKVFTDFAVCDWWGYCIALCDIKFSQI